MQEVGTSRYIRGARISAVPNYPASQHECSMAHTRQLGTSARLCRRLLRITTHGPGNRPRSSVVPRNAYFYGISVTSLSHDTTRIGCHKLSERLSRRGMRFAKVPPTCQPAALSLQRIATKLAYMPVTQTHHVTTILGYAAPKQDSKTPTSLPYGEIGHLKRCCSTLPKLRFP
jgi:hypothetical protein